MYAPERQEAIAALVRQQGRVSVAEVADSYGVTTETVRRDFAVLARVGLLRRVHGGAVPTASLVHVEAGLAERDRAKSEEKNRIARAALRLLPREGGSILIDGGSTTGRLAAQLPADARLQVITNSVPIAGLLAGTSLSLTLAGGFVRPETYCCVGEGTCSAIDRLRVDVAFMGTNGLTPSHGATTLNAEEAAVKRAMVAAARRVVILADETKMDREHLVRFAAPAEIDVVITDEEPEQDFSRGFAVADIEVVVA